MATTRVQEVKEKGIPTTRIQEIKEKHVPKYQTSAEEYTQPIRLSVLRSRAYTKVWKETEGEPISVRRAKAFAYYLDNLPIFINPGVLCM